MTRMHLMRIDQLGRVVTGKTPASEMPEEFGEEYPFITPSDIPQTQKYVSAQRAFSEKGFIAHKRSLLPPKSICVVCIGATIGKVCTTDQPSFANQQINSIVPNSSESSPEFVYYLATTLRDALVSFAGGSATPILNKSDFSAIKVLVPEIAAQRKVAAILSTYDDLIANNQRRITLLERMAEDIYREWFVRLRFPGYENVKIEKGVPQGWTLSSLGSIAEFTMGQSPSSEFFNEIGNGLPFHQGVGSYGSRYPSHETFCSVSGRKAKQGDILFSVRAPVGRLNIADRELIIGRGLAAIRHKFGFNGYLLYLLKVAFASEDVIGNGSIFNSVGKDELARLAVFEPDLKLVRKFEAVVNPIEQQISALYKSVASLKLTRDSLLPRLISGKLSVDALDIRFPPGMVDADA